MFLPKIVNITVTGGSGSATAQIAGTCVGIGIKPPAATAQFDFDITDEDSQGVAGQAGCKGTITIRDYCQTYGNLTFSISNATTNGTYQVKLWFSN